MSPQYPQRGTSCRPWGGRGGDTGGDEWNYDPSNLPHGSSNLLMGKITGTMGKITGAMGKFTEAMGKITGVIEKITGAMGKITGVIGSPRDLYFTKDYHICNLQITTYMTDELVRHQSTVEDIV